LTSEVVRVGGRVGSSSREEHTVPHAPGLDGLRGLALVAVVAYHLDLQLAGGGYLGVEVFFTLSGFLITQLVVAELSRTGRFDVREFVRARARRLLPALLLCVAGTLAAYRVLLPAEVPGLRWDALASLSYLQNWQLALGGMPYSESFARPSPLLHVWSLSVEAQLYLVWPVLFVVVLARLSRWTAVTLTLLLAWLSAVAMAVLYSPDAGALVYYVTPARASGFLVGAALALAYRPHAWSRRLPRPVDALLDGAGLAALVTVVVAFVTVMGTVTSVPV
jgi:peptidoglycan/LPS O-acetylase OafA/YrhL